MRIERLQIENYRSIENLKLSFPNFYTAICGKNDAGKSNIIRVLQRLFRSEDRAFWPPNRSISLKDDYTKWKEKESTSSYISFHVTLAIRPDDDEGLYKFLESYLQLSSFANTSNGALEIDVKVRVTSSGEKLSVRVAGQDLEELKAEEVLKRLKSSFTVLFHDSTEFFHPYRFLESTGLFREIPAAESKKIEAAKVNLEKAFTKIAKRNQEDLSEVLGRLKDKYRIGLSVERFETSEIPYSITLGSDELSVELENWGSGTQNRTRILMTLFKAKKVRDSAISASKITPIIVIEEPESYLHPSAQAEFGAILRDLAEEFKVQVIVTTHSPYLLSLERPEANLLLERSIVKKKIRETVLVDTKGDHWMQPFCQALGLSSSEVEPWKGILFTNKESVLLVEGETDKKYLELLSDASHGVDRFENEIEYALKDLGLAKGKDYMAIGKDSPGKRAIEGLLPDSVFQAVYSANIEFVQAATGTGNEAKSAKSRLKRLFLEQFEAAVAPGSDDCKHLYQLTKQLSKMLN